MNLWTVKTLNARFGHISMTSLSSCDKVILWKNNIGRSSPPDVFLGKSMKYATNLQGTANAEE